VTTPTHGNLTTPVSNVVTYTPNANYAGSDSFAFQAYNGANYSVSAGTVSLTITSSCIIDDSSASGFTTTGLWTANTVASAYLGNLHYAADSSTSTATATATWTFNVTSGNSYQVAATWVASTNRATNAPYRVNGGTPVLVNQKAAPSGLSSNGTNWQILAASYTATSGTLTVQLGNTANGYVIADAVMITIVPAGIPSRVPARQ
jgi:hypothetical protein